MRRESKRRKAPNRWSDMEIFSVICKARMNNSRRVTRLKFAISHDTEGVDVVEVNGHLYFREGTVRDVIRVAPQKYKNEQFNEVNDLQLLDHYSQKAALEKVADKYGFNYENFRRQYFARGWHKVKCSSQGVR